LTELPAPTDPFLCGCPRNGQRVRNPPTVSAFLTALLALPLLAGCSGAMAADGAPGGAGMPLPALADDPPQPVPEDPAAGTARHAAIEAALTRVRTLRREGRLAECIDLARTAEDAQGEDARLRLEAAWAFLGQAEEGLGAGADKFYVKGMVADAHLRHDAAVALDPGVETATALLARILRYEEDPDRARAVLEAHLPDHPDDLSAHRELADLAFNSRDWVTADVHFTRAFELDPTDGDARLRSTIARQWLQVPADTLVRGYLDAARLRPMDHRPIDLLGKFHKGDKQRRLALFRRVAKECPGNAWVHVWIAFIHSAETPKDARAAVRTLRAAPTGTPDDGAVQYNLGKALEQAALPLEAVDAYVRALELGDPGRAVQASNELDRLLASRELEPLLPIEKRDRGYDLLIEKNPLEGRFGNNAGFFYRDRGPKDTRPENWEKSTRYYQASVEAEPEDQDYLNDTGLMFLFHLRDRKHECLPLFEKVLRLVEEEGQEPIRGYWDALENLCKYWFEEGRYEQVLACAEKRADPSANLRGRRYPSRKAQMWALQARRKLDGK